MLLEGFLEEVEAVEKVVCLSYFDLRFGIQFGHGILQFDRFIGCPTSIALVTTGPISTARGTCALHVPVR